MKKWNLLIEAMAQEILNSIGYLTGPIDIEAIAKAHGINIVEYNFNSGDFTEESVSGTLVVKGNIKTIGVDILQDEKRRRFTIAHELGHYFLGHGKKNEVVLDTYTMYRNNNSSSGTKVEEVQANAFAAALLMPSIEVEKLLDKKYIQYGFSNVLSIIEDMAKYFNVSQISMSIRLNRLGLINTDDYIF